jgi:hypothetical protein
MDKLNWCSDPQLLCLLRSKQSACLKGLGKHGQLAASEMLCNDGCHVLGLAVAELLVDDVGVLDDRCLSCLLT